MYVLEFACLTNLTQLVFHRKITKNDVETHQQKQFHFFFQLQIQHYTVVVIIYTLQKLVDLKM